MSEHSGVINYISENREFNNNSNIAIISLSISLQMSNKIQYII